MVELEPSTAPLIHRLEFFYSGALEAEVRMSRLRTEACLGIEGFGGMLDISTAMDKSEKK